MPLTCSAILGMIQVHVPEPAIVDTIGERGGEYRADVAACLEAAGVPKSVLAAVRARSLPEQPPIRVDVRADASVPAVREARALEARRLDIAAEVTLREALGDPASSTFGAVLAEELALVERTGDPTAFLPWLGTLPPHMVLVGTPALDHLRARAWLDAEEPDLALPLVVDDRSFEGRMIAARAYRSTFRGEELVAVLRKAVEVAEGPQRNEALLALGDALEWTGHHADAVTTLLRVPRDADQWPRATAHAADAAWMDHDPDRARRMLSRLPEPATYDADLLLLRHDLALDPSGTAGSALENAHRTMTPIACSSDPRIWAAWVAHAPPAHLLTPAQRLAIEQDPAVAATSSRVERIDRELASIPEGALRDGLLTERLASEARATTALRTRATILRDEAYLGQMIRLSDADNIPEDECPTEASPAP